ncbi:MAG: hypothetical protein D6696_03000 [Acidobacteria bacterium]|nr:MAG: hypothetical protein D6696_03000 [Acidobacteriota bacterium]
MTWLEDPIAAIAALPPLTLPLVVFAAAFLEYVVPPFWGDTVILLGFFLAGQGVIGWGEIFAAAFAGGLLGAVAAYLLGRRYGLRAVRRLTPRRRSRFRSRERVQRLFARFGERVLLLNRFLPVVRGLMLYAAGAMHLRLRPVLVYCTVGNLPWIVLLMTVGMLTGGSWDQILASFRGYSQLLGAFAFGVLLLWLGWLVWQYRRV